MGEIIEDSLTLARGGSEVTEPERVELQSVASRAWQTVGGGDGLVVDDEATVSADPDRLQRILENLFRNSFEHASGDEQPSLDNPVEAEAQMPDGSGQKNDDIAITVTIGTLDDAEGFYVEDDGPGIPPADRDEVFEAGVSGAEMGSGLGLAIVRRVAEAHGWTVSVTDGRDGGARFEFYTDPE
jgi:Signal transduction histidine kinase